MCLIFLLDGNLGMTISERKVRVSEKIRESVSIRLEERGSQSERARAKERVYCQIIRVRIYLGEDLRLGATNPRYL